MSKNIEIGKNFVNGCLKHKEEDNNMNEKKCESEKMINVRDLSLVEDNSSTVEKESNEKFWEKLMVEPKPDFLCLWDEIEGYSKFRSLHEMEEQELFFTLLIRNEELRNNKSIRDLKQMAAKYAKDCLVAEKVAKEKTSTRVAEALKQHGFNPVFERSMSMNEEEIKDFMNFVRNSEWLQYIDQTAEEIEQLLMEHCAESADSIIEGIIEKYEPMEAEYSHRAESLF